jgi:hypothetical protein
MNSIEIFKLYKEVPGLLLQIDPAIIAEWMLVELHHC